MARITLKKPYANVRSVLAANMSLPSFDSHLNGIITLESIVVPYELLTFDSLWHTGI
jgi:hypothetical protein